jgi:membrane associated rhomboid family serine protease
MSKLIKQKSKKYSSRAGICQDLARNIKYTIGESRPREFMSGTITGSVLRIFLYSSNYSCYPPKLFIILGSMTFFKHTVAIHFLTFVIFLVTFAQILTYALKAYVNDEPSSENVLTNSTGLIQDYKASNATRFIDGLKNSYLIYDPDKREEAWRFVTYIFLHGDKQHIAWNALLQLLVGEHN